MNGRTSEIRRAALHLGVPAGRIAFFDDTPVNVEAARAAGIAASRVDGFAALEARLDDLGITDCNDR